MSQFSFINVGVALFRLILVWLQTGKGFGGHKHHRVRVPGARKEGAVKNTPKQTGTMYLQSTIWKDVEKQIKKVTRLSDV